MTYKISDVKQESWPPRIVGSMHVGMPRGVKLSCGDSVVIIDTALSQHKNFEDAWYILESIVGVIEK